MSVSLKLKKKDTIKNTAFFSFSLKNWDFGHTSKCGRLWFTQTHWWDTGKHK